MQARSLRRSTFVTHPIKRSVPWGPTLTRSMGSGGAPSTATDDITAWIEAHRGQRVQSKQSAGASDWAKMFIYTLEDGSKFFAKVARGRGPQMFQGERAGLNAMHASGSLVIPKVHHVGVLEGEQGARSQGSWILMDYLEFGGAPNQEELGRLMAKMHLAEPLDDRAKQGMFGFEVDNTIGGTAQPNPWTSDWIEFFREHRIRHQLRLIQDAQLTDLGERICASMEVFFEGAGEIRPSILHGDLWSGNIASVGGRPSIYDPACYYGHHEAEWGMDWCAGLGPAFWRGYRSLIPEAPGFHDRHKLYTLYHILNHYHMFGGGYRAQSIGLMQDLTKKL